MIFGVLVLVGCTTSPEATPATQIINECQRETVFVEFGDQTLQVRCSYWDENELEKIYINGSIEVETVGELDYIKIGDRMVIMPEFHSTLDYHLLRNEERGWKCSVFDSFQFNVTISGKTIGDKEYIDVEECRKTYDCGIKESILRRFDQ